MPEVEAHILCLDLQRPAWQSHAHGRTPTDGPVVRVLHEGIPGEGEVDQRVAAQLPVVAVWVETVAVCPDVAQCIRLVGFEACERRARECAHSCCEGEELRRHRAADGHGAPP
eukprot:6440118-Prymnesium_polylepis.1